MGRVIAFLGGQIGRSILHALPDSPVAIVCDEPSDYRHGPFVAKPWDIPVLRWSDAPDLAAFAPTHGLCAGFRHILKRDTIDLFPHGIANVHTSLLPLNRGAHPNAWAIFYGQGETGVTLHLIDDGVDTGPVIAQVRVAISGTDTAASLQARLLKVAVGFTGVEFPQWVRGGRAPAPQADSKWPTRRKADLESIMIDGSKKYQGFEAINILRARTFPGHPGALYVAPDGKRYRVTINIEEDHA